MEIITKEPATNPGLGEKTGTRLGLSKARTPSRGPAKLGLRLLRSGYDQVVASNSDGVREVGYGCQQYVRWEPGVAAGTKCPDRNTEQSEGESCLSA